MPVILFLSRVFFVNNILPQHLFRGLVKINFIIFLLITRLCFTQTLTDKQFSNEIDTSLSKLIKMQTEVSFIHPALQKFYPIATIQGDSLFIYDYSKEDHKYRFVKQTPVPFPMSEDLQASFPLSVYDNIPTCVAGKKIFNSLKGYTIITHEFVHCWQAGSVEQDIKSKLKIAQNAMAKQDYMWELNHPFPYSDTLFVMHYKNFIAALQNKEIDKAKSHRTKLKNYLSDIDFEYMVWEEWTEGTARYVENKIQAHFLIDINTNGKSEPFNRVIFYYGGALWANALIEVDEKLLNEPMQLFNLMGD